MTIVTGASSGIGREIARQFVESGADVVVCSREREHVDEVASDLENPDDPDAGRCVAVECDVTDREAVDALVEATVDEFGRIDALINNAGASFTSPFEEISENGWKRVVDINLHGAYHCTQAAADHLDTTDGVVVNIASVAGKRPARYMSHYGAAKAGLINLTETLAVEWARNDVRVNCVAPGYVATPGIEEQLGITADDVDRNEVDRRIGTTGEIADVVRFLVSDAASFVTGETVVAQGPPPAEELPDVS